MSYSYQPRFEGPAFDAFRALDVWLQEAVLDEVDLLLRSVVPNVAERLHPADAVHIASRTVDGVEHLLFLVTTLDVPARTLRIRRVGHTAQP